MSSAPAIFDTNESRLRRAGMALIDFNFGIKQEALIYDNKPKGLSPMRQPCDYAALKECEVTERKLEVPKYRFSHERANYVVCAPGEKESIVIWEKKAQAGKPHYLFFHGTNGHWGDSWPTDNPQDRESRTDFLKQISDSGAGFTAVNLRGYGRSEGQPSQAAHICDIQAVVKDIIQQPIAKDKLIVLGSSLGSWAAVETAAQLTEQGRPPALLQLVNPFASMVKLGTDTINNDRLVKAAGIRMSEQRVARFLRHPMRSVDRIAQLSPETALCVATSGADRLIDNEHSSMLLEAAKKRGLRVQQTMFPGASHTSIPSKAVVELSRQAYDHCNAPARDDNFWTTENMPAWSQRIQPPKKSSPGPLGEIQPRPPFEPASLSTLTPSARSL